MLFTIITGTVFQLITLGESFAIFETKIESFTNPANRTMTRQCCQSGIVAPSGCHLSCQTFFSICVDDLHLVEPNCIFGRNQSQIFQKSSLTHGDIGLKSSIKIASSVSWPGTFGLRILVIDNSTRASASKGIIQSSEFVGSMLPGRRWHVRNETGPVSTLSYKYRVLCGANYYGRNCTIYCQARNDYHGHYGCDGDGRIYCLSGWTNVKSYCTTPICLKRCINGRCTAPDVCSCNIGWAGATCSKCQTRPGCVNGTCVTPGECDCNSGWGGLNCDKEMDYCAMHRPCQNGGVCINQGLGAFRCYCLGGATGHRCETRITACTSSPCMNGGTCRVRGGGFSCNCAPRFTGMKCETRWDPCAAFVCRNNGTCIATGHSASCHCAAGFTGNLCASVAPVIFTSFSVEGVTQRKTLTTQLFEPSKSTAHFPVTVDYTAVSVSYNLESTMEQRILTTLSKTAHQASASRKQTDVMNNSVFYGQSSLTIRQLPLSRTKSVPSTAHPTMSIASSSTSVQQASMSVNGPQISLSSSLAPFRSSTVNTSRLFTPVLVVVTPSMAINSTLGDPHRATLIEASLTVALSSQVLNSKVKKTHHQSSSKRSMAIGISVSISFVIIIIIPLICILVKFSKRRGKHELQKSSSIIPASMNNPCRLIDAGAMRKFSTNINAGHYPVEHIENSSSISERSQVVSSRDINIESNSFHVPANIDSRDRYLNKFNSLTNFGYLSEGTSGYDSENSSARSSANYSSRQSKSTLSTDDITVSRVATNTAPSRNLPNCIVYHEEYMEVEL